MKTKTTQTTTLIEKQLNIASIKWLLLFGLFFGIQNTFAQKTWDAGAGSNNWTDANNWSGNTLPVSTDNVVIGNGFTVSLSASATVASLTVGGGTSGSLTISGNTDRTLTVSGNVTVNSGATITATGNNGHDLNIGGNLTNAGTFSDAGGLMDVTFNGSTQTISGAGTFLFRDFLFSTGGSKSINSAITVSRNWNNTSATVSGSGTVSLTGTGSISATTTASFPNLTVSGTATQTDNTVVNGNFNQTGGTYFQNNGSTGYSLTVTGNFTLSGNSAFGMQATSGGTGATTTVNGATGTTISGTATLFMDFGGAVAANRSIFQTTNLVASSTENIIDFGDEGNTKNNEFRISGNCTKTGTDGSFYTSSSSVNGGLVFNGSGTTQLVSIVPSTNLEYYNITVNSGAVVQINAALALGSSSNPSSSLTVNGTLDAQGFTISGGNSGVFTLASGANLITANANGIVSTTTGTVSTSFATRTFNAAANYTFDRAGSQTANFPNTALNSLTISNTSGTVTLNAAITASNVTITSGASLTAGTFTHAISGSWTNNGGTFVPGTGTISLNGTTQTIGGTSSSINFNNLSVSGGTKTFSKPLAISGNLSIASGALANLGALTTHTAGTLTLGGVGTAAAKFGSTSTSATPTVYKNNTYFTAGTTGYITVGTGSCTAPTITFGTIPSVCPGVTSVSLPYTAITGGANLYAIAGTGITTVIDGTLAAAPSSITVGLSTPATTGTISTSAFTVSNSVTGCTSANINSSVTVNLTVATPAFTLGATALCQDAPNETYTATASGTTGITYSVLPGSAGTIGSSTGIMNWSSTFFGNATITASAAGCGGPKTIDRVVVITPSVATPSFTAGATSFCQDAPNTTYTAIAANNTGITYSIAPTAAGTIDAETGEVNWAAGYDGNATITATATGCNGPKTVNRSVTINPTIGNPTFTFGPTAVCQDAATSTYAASASDADEITFSVLPATAGNMTNAIGLGFMNWSSTFSGTATITATATGCGGPKTVDRIVTVTATVGTPTFDPTPATVCQDAPDSTYSASASDSTGITYSVSPAAAGTIGSTSGIMNWSASFTGNATITASAAGCNGPKTSAIVVFVNSSPTATAGDVSGCAGSEIALSGSGSPTGGEGIYSVANPFIGASSTTYTYTYTDANGCSATSSPANITITPQPLWYLDADGDHYYAGSAVPSCTNPGPGYTNTGLLGGNDCDDSTALFNPGATDICYNNADENCDGILSDGCAPVVVNITPSYDNTTLVSLSQAVPAVGYTYLNYTNLKYRFSITNTTTGVTSADIIQTSRYVTIPGAMHSYPGAYDIKVSAVINEEIVAFAGNTVRVNAPALQLITLSTESCGATLTTLASTLTASPGPNATGYTFRIRLNDANPTPTYAISQSSTRFVGANTFTAFPLEYAASYKVSVRYTYTDPVTNVPVESPYGAECTVNTPSIPVTNLASPTCNSQVATMNANISGAAAPYATGYRFRIRLFTDNGPTPTYYYSLPNASRFSSLSAFQGITFAYSTDYMISVEYSILNGSTTVWSGFGAECKVKTPFFPVTSLVPSQCGLETPTSLTQQLNITPYPGFPNYRVKLEEIDGEDVVNSQEITVSYSYFRLSQFSIAQLGKNYNVSVAIKQNGVFGDYDTACDLFTPAPSKAIAEVAFKATAYPNPFANNFMIDVKTSSESNVNIKVYDMIGRIVEQRDVRVSDLENTTIGNQYPSGVYNVAITQENNVQTLRVVKR